MNKINIEQICTIRVMIDYVNRRYEYREEKKFLWWVISPAGFYYVHAIHPYLITPEEIAVKNQHRCIIRDKEVIFKPHVEITLSNGLMYEKFFETQSELDGFLMSDYIRGIKLINQ